MGLIILWDGPTDKRKDMTNLKTNFNNYFVTAPKRGLFYTGVIFQPYNYELRFSEHILSDRITELGLVSALNEFMSESTPVTQVNGHLAENLI